MPNGTAPSQWDLYGWGQGGGNQELLDYLSGLMESSYGGFQTGYGTGSDYYGLTFGANPGGNVPGSGQSAEQGGGGFNFADFFDMMGSQGMGFGGTGSPTGGSWLDMSQDELFDWSQDMYEQGVGGFAHPEGLYGENPFTQGGFTQDSLTQLMALQDMFQNIPTTEEFGLSGKLGTAREKANLQRQQARSSYLPMERKTRYGALQGGGGNIAAGEASEQQYLSSMYGANIAQSQDISDAYEDYFGYQTDAINTWLSAL